MMKMLLESLVDVEDAMSTVSDGDDIDEDVINVVVVVRLCYGWMSVALMDKFLDEQVHVRLVADYCRVLYSLLLLHFPHQHLLFLRPPKLKKVFRYW